jgi:hypothetical protein
VLEEAVEQTKNSVRYELLPKLAGDVLVACTVTLGVAPFMSVIDKAIVERANGTKTILKSSAASIASIVRSPVTFVKSPVFLMMWGVYAATYTTANCLKTIVEYQDKQKQRQQQQQQQKHKSANTSMPPSMSSGIGGKFGVFAITTGVNSSTTMFKDKFYARHFGAANAATKVPLITYGLWGLRDCMVIGSSFILPEYTSCILQERFDMDKTRALQISQLTCPIATQLVAGPVQLLGLDFYNRPMSELSYKAAALERLKFQCSNFTSIVGARIARIAPAYGVGGVGNTYFRDMWREMLVRRGAEQEHYLSSMPMTIAGIRNNRNNGRL